MKWHSPFFPSKDVGRPSKVEGKGGEFQVLPIHIEKKAFSKTGPRNQLQPTGSAPTVSVVLCVRCDAMSPSRMYERAVKYVSLEHPPFSSPPLPSMSRSA